MKTLAVCSVVLFAILSAGCSSEVDKCVDAWEAANEDVPDDSVQRYTKGHGIYKQELTKAEVRANVRERCLRAASGAE